MTAIAAPIATSGIRPRPRVWPVIAGLGVVVTILLITRQASLLRAGFPLLGTAAALWVYRYADFATYAAFVWWFWFLTPGLRRVVDFQAGSWNAENPMSLTPLLVTSLAALTVFHRLHELRRRRLWPWAVAVVCILFGFFSGVLRNGVLPATHALISWLVPLSFGLAIALEWRHYPASAVRFRQAFVWGGLLLAAYAVFQFLSPPVWDRLWIESAGMSSVGIAYPYRIRVFSLMNGPLLFALTLFAAMLLAFSGRGPWRIATIVAAVVALLLTLVRSVWLITIIGGLIYLYAMPLRLVKRAALAAASTVALLWGVVLILPADVRVPVVTVVQERILTLGHLHQDLSYTERAGFLEQISGSVLEQPLGHGLGSTGMSSTLGDPTATIKDFDNGVFAVLYSLGWFAGATLLGVALYLIVLAIPRREPRADQTAKAARAISVALFVLTVSSNVFEGLPAMLFWGFTGLLIAAHQWQSAVTYSAPRRART